MKESFWAIFIIMVGVIFILFVNFFQNITNTDDHNYNLLKETTEAAMYDAFDFASYRADGVIRIDREKFVENFIRRFAASANLARTYQIDIYDVNETPPKVSLKVSSTESSSITGTKGGVIDFELSNQLDAILETPY